MSDDLTVSGGGSIAVTTDDLAEEAVRLGVARQRCEMQYQRAAELLAMLERIDGFFGRAHHELFFGGYMIDTAGGVAGGLAGSLMTVAENYGESEALARAFIDAGARLGAWSLGMGTRLAIVPLLAAAGAAAGVAGTSAAILKLFGVEGGLPFDEDALRSLLSIPGLGEALGVTADSMDEFVMGLSGVPAPIAQLLGRDVGAPESAGILLGITAGIGGITGGFLTEREVTVRRAGATGATGPAGPAGVARATGAEAAAGAPTGRQVSGPTSLAEFADRVPDGGDGGPQIRVEQYSDGDTDKWVVYVAGTVDFALDSGEQPFDMLSNLGAVAEQALAHSPVGDALATAATERAVRQALAEAGYRPGDELAGVGYSGGGAVIGNLMRDPELNMVAGINLGGPARVEAGPTLINIEHVNDIVPSTGGADHPVSPVTVRREVDLAAERSDLIVPAHDLQAYQRTAGLADGNADPRLARARDELSAFTAGLTGTESMWHAERVSEQVTEVRSPGPLFDQTIPDPREFPTVRYAAPPTA